MGKLTEAQRRHLRWIDETYVTRSGWLEGTKPAQRTPEYWDYIRLSGPDGSRRIPSSDWEALDHLIEGGDVSESMWRLTPAGRAALELEGGDG